jgi:hypothetical protein
MLIARKAPRRHPRVAARWLQRYLEEHPAATIEEAGAVASCLAALGSPSQEGLSGCFERSFECGKMGLTG